MSLEPSEITGRLRGSLDRLLDLEATINLDAGRARIGELEAAMAQADFWDHAERAQRVIAELKQLRDEVEPLEEAHGRVADLLELAELAIEEGEKSTLADVEGSLEGIDEEIERLELKTTLSGKHDANSAYLSVHAGAGGTESCDWAQMLARMFRRFAESQGFKVEEVDCLPDEEAGIKNVTFHIKGRYAYGYLRSEVGVHRLVRKSPFDAKNKRHTSFAAVDVIPEFDDAVDDIDIPMSDLRIDTYRAGGAGGQHVNTTDSAVRITHLPSGVVVQCQSERSQHSNRAAALKVLKARLLHLEEQKREQELEKLYGEKGEIAWGNQIRSYVLDPYTLVKDRRTGHEVGNVAGVLDGELWPFIEAYLRHKRSGPSAGGASSK